MCTRFRVADTDSYHHQTRTRITMARGTLRNGVLIKQMPSPYSKQQIKQWLDVIKFDTKPEDGIDENAETLPAPTLDNLVILTRLHLIAFPFETTPIHYTSEHCMNVTPEGLFQRLVVQRRGGSYCYGLNGLLFGMLLGLGYRAYAGQARTNGNFSPNGPPNYLHTSHMVIFLQPFPESNVTYVVDTGFGGGGLTRPILLSDDPDNVIVGTTPSERHRLTKEPLPQASFDDPAWRLEVMYEKPNSSESLWRVIYSFSETEYFQCDFEAMSYFVSTHPPSPTSPFSTLRDIVFLKRYFWIDDTGDIAQKEMGTLTLIGRTVKRQIGQTTEELKRLETEEERIKAIKEDFGVHIDDDGIEHIRGRKAELTA
ncbi:hypothetical protein VKT23_013553 [Stygiomarasmius scandens]|uniref:Arylamine N-acetyltransferase n=1 Tax=Marasmiellus scandens TaxID=2682957 RepID=A0ABR1J3C5_9AGAR